MNDEFVSWIVNKKNYSQKSARDVRSRLKRLDSAIRIPDQYDDEFIKALDKNEIFNSYTIQIKSHTRRALRMFKEFKETR